MADKPFTWKATVNATANLNLTGDRPASTGSLTVRHTEAEHPAIQLMVRLVSKQDETLDALAKRFEETMAELESRLTD